MQLNLKIPDALYDKYLTRFGSPKHYVAMQNALKSFADVAEHDRFLLISGDVRREIEAVFQIPMESPEDLVKNIKKLNRVKIGGIDMTFDPEELARIDMQASFHGRTRQQYITEMVQEIKDSFLEKV